MINLSPASDMFKLMTNAESELLKNRSSVFKELKDEPIENIDTLKLQADLTRKRLQLANKNVKLLKDYETQARILINNEINTFFKKGVNQAVAQADEIIEEPKETTAKKEEILRQATQAMRQSQITAIRTQDNEFNNIAALLVGAVVTNKILKQKKKLYDIVDDTQRSYNAKGVVGKVAVNNREYGLAAYNETNIREQSQASLLSGGGAVVTEDDRVYVSQHQNASDACRPHQGKYYIDDVFRQGRRGQWDSLPLLSSVIAIKGRPGLFHFNCRHTVTLAPKSFKEPKAPNNAITNKDGNINKDKSNLTYKLEQQQRAYQRNIRQYKQVEANALTESERQRAKSLIRNNQAKLRQLDKFAKEKGVPFYRQAWKEDIEFKFETFKPEF